MQIPEKWVITQGFVIRHKPTGRYIRQTKGFGGSGYEPCDPKLHLPRLFETVASARGFITQWCRGAHYASEHGGIKVIPQPGRKKEDMEIVPVVLVHKDL